MSLHDLIAAWNPWWADPALRPAAPPRRRRLFEPLRAALEAGAGRAVALVGPRQVGKTALLKQLAQHILDSGQPPGNVLYFDFSDDRYASAHGLREVLETKAGGAREQAPRFLLLDEVTKAHRWDAALKQLVDAARSGPAGAMDRILVTDSASSMVRSGAKESLQGRIDEIRIHGLTFGEYLHLQGIGEEREQEVYLRVPNAFERYLKTGGFPEHVIVPDEDIDRTWERIRNDVSDRAIARDLAREERVDVERVIALFTALVQDAGGLFEPANRARDLGAPDGGGTDKRTVRHWVTLLEQASLLDHLPPWHRGLRSGHAQTSKALRKRVKLYPEDHGFIPAFSPLPSPMRSDLVRKAVFETAVFSHLRALRGERKDFDLYFFRENEDSEIDFVLAFRDEHVGVLGLEVTSSKSLDKKRSKAERAARRAQVNRLILVHGGPTQPRELDTHSEWPIEAFLLDPGGCIQRNLEWLRK